MSGIGVCKDDGAGIEKMIPIMALVIYGNNVVRAH